jgi:2-hydroxychromene-2-carboxylate isomerase
MEMKAMMYTTKKTAIIGALAAALMLGGTLGAQAQTVSPPFPVTPELIDSLDAEDATWPDDPAVPDLPPLSDTDDPPVPKDNFLYSHYWDGLHPPEKQPPAPLSPQSNLDEPLKVDVIWSMRSPYSYLVLQRLVWLHSNYNIDLTVRPVMPIAVRSTKGGSGSAGGAFGVWYKLPDAMWDTVRSAHYNGVPFKWPTPDPIWQNIHPVHGENWQYVHPPEKQPYIGWVVRLCAYAQMQGKSLECVNQLSHLIFGNQEEHWPAHVKERFNRIEGLDYDEAIRFIQENPEKVDAVWLENSQVQTQAGHGGVPLYIFNGEPFFGQDRFDQFVWRLRQSGLRQRHEPIPPFTSKPIRWPDAG